MGTPDPERAAELDSLVHEWLSVPEAAERQGVSLAHVRKQIQERQLVAVRRGPNNAVSIPADFVTADGPLTHLPGTIVVLADGGMDDADLIVWMYTFDDTLADGSSPIEQLRLGRKTEVRKRAMETAF